MLKLLSEIYKSIYMLLYKITYYFLSFFTSKKKFDTVIIANHQNNTQNYIRIYNKETFCVITENKYLLKKISTNPNMKKHIRLTLLSTPLQIVAILQANKVVIDDYYAASHVIDRSKEVWNIWHAYAVYKKIALLAPLYNKRNPLSISRFYKNYQRINKLFVRSKIEKEIFMESYKVSADQIYIAPDLYTSTLPREAYQKERKKVILYAPTHRPYEYDYDAVFIWLEKKYPDHKVVASYHQLTIRNPRNIISYSNQQKYNVDEILKVADIFVSDYSSLLVEVNDLCKYIKTLQVMDEKDWLQYNAIQGLNDTYYKAKIQQIQFQKNNEE